MDHQKSMKSYLERIIKEKIPYCNNCFDTRGPLHKKDIGENVKICEDCMKMENMLLEINNNINM